MAEPWDKEGGLSLPSCHGGKHPVPHPCRRLGHAPGAGSPKRLGSHQHRERCHGGLQMILGMRRWSLSAQKGTEKWLVAPSSHLKVLGFREKLSNEKLTGV